MSLTITSIITDAQLANVADYLVDEIYSEFSQDQINFAGLVKKEFVENLITYPKFLKMVKDCIKEYGSDVVEQPWDYGEVYLFEMDALYNHVNEFARIMDDALQDEVSQVELADAIVKLKRAGYNVWK